MTAGAVAVVVPHARALLNFNVIELLEKCAEHFDWLKRHKSNQGFLLQIKLTSYVFYATSASSNNLPDEDFTDGTSSFHFLY